MLKKFLNKDDPQQRIINKYPDHCCRDDVEVVFRPNEPQVKLRFKMTFPEYTVEELQKQEEEPNYRTLGFQILSLEILQKNGSVPHRLCSLNDLEVECLVSHLGIPWENVRHWEVLAPKEELLVDNWELRLHLLSKVYPNALVEDCFIPVFRKPDDFDTLPKWRQNMAMRVPWLYLHIKHFQTNNRRTYHLILPGKYDFHTIHELPVFADRD